MNYPVGTQYDSAAPWNERDVDHLFECDNCFGIFATDYDEEHDYREKVEMKGKCYCEDCIDEAMFTRPVSEMTDDLVKAVDWENYDRIWKQEFDKTGRVKHI